MIPQRSGLRFRDGVNAPQPERTEVATVIKKADGHQSKDFFSIICLFCCICKIFMLNFLGLTPLPLVGEE